jgi:hypothetical protein
MANYHDQRYTAHRHDHERDYRKHEPRPGDRGFSPPAQDEPPARLDTMVSEALELAVVIKCGSTTLSQAAELIHLYARNVAAADRLDAVAAGARP